LSGVFPIEETTEIIVPMTRTIPTINAIMLIMINLLSYLFCFLKALKNDILTVIKARADDAIPIARGNHIPV
jgi:hypothetical protein